MRRRLVGLAVVCATAVLGFTAASAVSARTGTAQTQMQVGFKIGKFVKQGGGS